MVVDVTTGGPGAANVLVSTLIEFKEIYSGMHVVDEVSQDFGNECPCASHVL